MQKGDGGRQSATTAVNIGMQAFDSPRFADRAEFDRHTNNTDFRDDFAWSIAMTVDDGWTQCELMENSNSG
jgi:hypothetical protein